MVRLEVKGTPTKTERLVGYRHAEGVERRFLAVTISPGTTRRALFVRCVTEAEVDAEKILKQLIVDLSDTSHHAQLPWWAGEAVKRAEDQLFRLENAEYFQGYEDGEENGKAKIVSVLTNLINGINVIASYNEDSAESRALVEMAKHAEKELEKRLNSE